MTHPGAQAEGGGRTRRPSPRAGEGHRPDALPVVPETTVPVGAVEPERRVLAVEVADARAGARVLLRVVVEDVRATDRQRGPAAEPVPGLEVEQDVAALVRVGVVGVVPPAVRA